MRDFKAVYDHMKAHGIPTPHRRIDISIDDAKNALNGYFEYFLAFENKQFIFQEEYNDVIKWLENNQGRGLFLYGDCGKGKSMLCRYVIPAILLQYYRKIVKVYDVKEMNSNIDKIKKEYIICLDDIGTEGIVNEFGNKRMAFPEIIDSVEKYDKLIIVSTNLRGNQLIDMYGERTYERIVSTTKRIEFKGKSLRS